MRGHSHALQFKVCFLIVVLVGAEEVAAGERIVWKPMQAVVLRVNERAPGKWNVYEGEKRPRTYLVQFDKRVVLLDVDRREAFDLDPASLVKSDAGVEWEDARAEAVAQPEPAPPGKGKPRRLVIEEWTVRDVGRADRIKVKLGGAGTVIDLQIPHPLSRRSAY